MYSTDCLFADPTISFRGRARYMKNLNLLKGFFILPRIDLYGLQKQEGRSDLKVSTPVKQSQQ